MDDAEGVRLTQGRADLRHDLQRAPRGQDAAHHVVAEWLAAQELHHQIGHAAWGDGVVVQDDDMRAAQLGDHAGFLQEALTRAGIGQGRAV